MVLFLELSETADLSNTRAGKLLVPPIEGLLRHAHLPDNLGEGLTPGSLAKCEGDLSFGESLLHVLVLLPPWTNLTKEPSLEIDHEARGSNNANVDGVTICLTLDREGGVMRIRPNYITLVAFFAAMCHHEVSPAQVLPMRFRVVPNSAAQETTQSIPPNKQRMSLSGIDTTSINKPIESVLVTIKTKDPTRSAPLLFPLNDSTKTLLYWGKDELSALQNLNVSISTAGFSLYSEFVSDFLVIGGRWVRVGFGGLVSKSDTSKAKGATSSAIQRFMAGGGNALLQVATPILFARGTTGRGADLLLVLKLAADLPAVNADVTRFSGSVDVGVDLLGFISSVQEKFGFFGQVRLSVIAGGGDYYKNLGLSNKPFYAGTATIGVNINNAFRVSTGAILLGPLRHSAPWQIGAQLLAVD
jgi:hypothetical protein